MSLLFLLEDKAIYNYRLSRARRVIENSFGILAARWHIFHRPIIADPTKVVLYIQAAIALHNFLRSTESSYCPPGFTDGEDGSGNFISGSWRNDEDPCAGMHNLTHIGSNRLLQFVCFLLSLNDSSDVRDDYKSYFNSPDGEVY